jgi:hypothetical protein
MSFYTQRGSFGMADIGYECAAHPSNVCLCISSCCECDCPTCSPLLLASCLHPLKGRVGTEVMADMLVHWLGRAVGAVELAVAARGKRFVERGFSPASLPPPDNVRGTQVVTRVPRARDIAASVESSLRFA